MLASGEVGELHVRGAHIMQGYWGNDGLTATKLRPGRWPWERTMATGDLFRIDEDGFLYFVARQDDIFKSRLSACARRRWSRRRIRYSATPSTPTSRHYPMRRSMSPPCAARASSDSRTI